MNTGNNTHVVVLGNSEINFKGLIEQLDELNTPFEFFSDKDSLSRLEQNKYYVFVIDHMVPDIDLKFLLHLKERYPEGKFILLRSHDPSYHDDEMKDFPFYRILVKSSSNAEQLKEITREVSDEKQQHINA